MGLFGNFTEVPYGDLSEMICKTDNLIASEEQNIAEASFTHDGLFCSVDILRNLGGGNVELYEVKSSTSGDNDKRVDTAFQYDYWRN